MLPNAGAELAPKTGGGPCPKGAEAAAALKGRDAAGALNDVSGWLLAELKAKGARGPAIEKPVPPPAFANGFCPLLPPANNGISSVRPEQLMQRGPAPSSLRKGYSFSSASRKWHKSWPPLSSPKEGCPRHEPQGSLNFAEIWHGHKDFWKGTVRSTCFLL